MLIVMFSTPLSYMPLSNACNYLTSSQYQRRLADQNSHNFARGMKHMQRKSLSVYSHSRVRSKAEYTAKQDSAAHLAWATDNVSDAVAAAFAAFETEEAGK